MIKVIEVNSAPKAIGPYSQAVVAGGTVYVSGQLPLSAETMTMPSAVEKQAHQVFKNLFHILNGASANCRVVKVAIYLKNMDDFDKVNAVYNSYFQPPYPARVCVEVARLPKNALIEADAIAVIE